ncbi:AI-2E family transporter [candidate division KSB1 bacterium]|nr:AI-2E family transporter [candidate division KSB1 bacterium]
MAASSETSLMSVGQKRILIAVLSLLTLVLVSFILKQLGSILKPFLIAVFMVNILLPVTSAMERKKIPRILSYIIVVVFVLLIFYLVGFFIYKNIGGFAQNSLIYERKLNQLIGGLLGNLGIIEKDVPFKLRDFKILQWLPTGSITAFFTSSLGSFFDLVGNSAVLAFFMLFLIAEVRYFNARVIKAYGRERADHILEIVRNINTSVRKYILVKLVVSLATGVLATIVMGIFNLDFFIFFGILTFLLNFIPYLGSIIATALPAVIAFLQFNSPWTAVWLLLILLLIQNVLGSVVEPKIQGHQLNLSPLVVLFSVMFWGWLWDSVGMILSIPIMATIRIIFEQIGATRPIAIFMSEMED